MDGSSSSVSMRPLNVSHEGAAQFHSELARRRGAATQQSSEPCAFNAPNMPKTFWVRRGKRGFDIAFSLTFLAMVGWWLIPSIGLAIKLDSRGPVYFKQRRTGLNGETFWCLKFRTMRHVPNAGFRQAQPNDDRVTRVGKLLRKTNLDELPQFINVLRGEMSVVGPRPHVPELDAKFSRHVPGYAARHAIKPGVTGLAQVSGCRGETRSVREMRNRFRFDCFYLRNAGPALDVRIIARTVIAMLGGDDRAY